VLRQLFQKYWYISFPFLSLYCFPAGIACAHGWGPLILFGNYGYGFMGGILGAFVFSALSKRNPILASLCGMFVGMGIVAVGVSIMMGSPLYGVLSILTFGAISYIAPGILLGVAIGILFKYFKRGQEG
jgi:hypothetical protein